jgi:RNA polymerase subunit RPABC4/transcription elongation factor Spt4
VLLSWPGGDWQTTVRFIAAALITYVVALWIAMVWWTYRDSRERTRDPFMQALAVFLVLFFNFAGLVIYLLTRPRHTLAEAYARTLEEEALLQDLEDLKACPTCRRRVEDDYVICPTCQTQLKEPCSRCTKPLSYSWAACPFCAQPRRAAAQPRRTPEPAPAPAVEATTAVAVRPAATNGASPAGVRPATEEPV